MKIINEKTTRQTRRYINGERIMDKNDRDRLIELMALVHRDLFIRAFRSVRGKFQGSTVTLNSVTLKMVLELNPIDRISFYEKIKELAANKLIDSAEIEHLLRLAFRSQHSYAKKNCIKRQSTLESDQLTSVLIDEKDLIIYDDMIFPDFSETFQNLKRELITRSLDRICAPFDLNSKEAQRLYEEHVCSFEIGTEFSNVGLLAFTAMNRVNSGARANMMAWKTAMIHVASNSPHINGMYIERALEVEESRNLLIEFMQRGGRLADTDKANNNSYLALKENRSGSTPIQVLETVRDVTDLVSTLEEPNIFGLVQHLRASAEGIQTNAPGQDVWADSLLWLEEVRGHGRALASNFLKDLMLFDWNQNNGLFENLAGDVVGKANKPDRHINRVLTLLTQPMLLKSLIETRQEYSQFKEKDAQYIIQHSGPHPGFNENYYAFITGLSHSANICLLELDRVLFGLFSGQIASRGGITIEPLTLKQLSGLIS